MTHRAKYLGEAAPARYISVPPLFDVMAGPLTNPATMIVGVFKGIVQQTLAFC